MGNSDPTDLINMEIVCIALKHSNMNVQDWNDVFRSWPNVTPRWRNWYLRMAASKRTIWDEYDIVQCTNLSLSNIAINESILITTSHFWSDSLNAFLFGHGPMTPTLADVLMLIGLNISAPDLAYNLLPKTTHKLETKNIGGWKGYIDHHARKGVISDREHMAFLNMWLEKFIFWRKTIGPTTNMQAIAESLATGHLIPFGKHPLGPVFSLLHQISVRLLAGQPIGNLGGP
jgi:hypothetical protein